MTTWKLSVIGNRILWKRLFPYFLLVAIFLTLSIGLSGKLNSNARWMNYPFFIESRSSLALPSPFYVHYVRFKGNNNKFDLRFLDYLSILSAHQRLKPDGILVHGDIEPTGETLYNSFHFTIRFHRLINFFTALTFVFTYLFG